MKNKAESSRLAKLLQVLQPKAKPPTTARTLNTWIAQAEPKIGVEGQGGRLGWLVASSVAIAAVQRAINESGKQ